MSLCALELVPWWFVLVGSGYLHALELVPWWLVCLVGSWLACPLLMYLGARALVVRVGWKWLPACLEPCALLVGVSLVGVLGGGYLHALELVPWWFVLVGSGYLHALVVGVSLCTLVVCPWLVCLVGSWLVVTCMPWSSCLGGVSLVGGWRLLVHL